MKAGFFSCLHGGWGNDLLNADDDLETNGGLNDSADGPDASQEDMAYGGAGRDILIGNTGGDRLIDWSGEFNSYIVPFAAFGLGTISRSPTPQLFDYLYDLSAGDGADPTRAGDTGGSADRNGEPNGELGLVKQSDDAWQAQTGAPADPQPGNIPGGERDVLSGADFNNGSPQGFFVDSGSLTTSGGRLEVAPKTAGGDAASVFHLEDPLPSYFEVKATINAGKPTAGLKSNAYIIFDYQSATDFKYAGINISHDKLEMGYRDASGWHEINQTNAQLKSDRDYQVLLAINGTVATLVVDNQQVFTHTFNARIDEDGYSYGLNAGLVGLGSTNSKARIDNVKIQVLPPDITLEDMEDFSDGLADLYTGGTQGQWQITGQGSQARYEGAPVAGEALAYQMTSLTIGSPYLVQWEATLSTNSIGGMIFDADGSDRFKFAGISADAGEVVIGHYTPKRGYVINASIHRGIEAGTDYNLKVTLKGSTVSVELDGQVVLGHSFNAVIVDGGFGLMSQGGSTSFGIVTVGTNDPAYQGENLLADITANRSTAHVEPLTIHRLVPIFDEALRRWNAEGTTIDSSADWLHLEITDLPGATLGTLRGNSIYFDIDAAGYGWFIDATPGQDEEFAVERSDTELYGLPASPAYGRFDLLTVAMHEVGHYFGYEHSDETGGVMDAELQPAIRRAFVSSTLIDGSSGDFSESVVIVHDEVVNWPAIGTLAMGWRPFSDDRLLVLLGEWAAVYSGTEWYSNFDQPYKVFRFSPTSEDSWPQASDGDSIGTYSDILTDEKTANYVTGELIDKLFSEWEEDLPTGSSCFGQRSDGG